MLTSLRRPSRRRRHLAGIACIVSIPAALQLAGGWNDAGILEEWGLFELFSRRGPQFWLSTSSAISSQALRPLSAFPAWSGIFLFRTTQTQMASALVTIAAWLLVRSNERTSWPEVAVMACAGCAAMMAYEAYYSVVVFVPLVLVLSGPITRTRFALLSGLWFIGPFLNGLRMMSRRSHRDPGIRLACLAHVVLPGVSDA
ncbi:MAG: hypothetical protein Q7V57_16475 [Actinomycetota bacterium]|nr:hypothetical protein [Actinomycetota bacterium]